jgi:hypothetical protein
MLFMTEYLAESQIIAEKDESGEKQLYIEGIYAQSGIKNRNGRVYPTEIMDNAMERYIKEKVDTKRALGELNHPNTPAVNPREASHRIVELRKDGNNWIGKALVLETDAGNCVRALLKGGTSIGVSTRALGTLKNVSGIMEVQNDLIFSAVDVVTDPSAPAAFVNGIMEGVEFFPNEHGVFTPKRIEEIRQDVLDTSSVDLPAKYVEIFRSVMESTFK